MSVDSTDRQTVAAFRKAAEAGLGPIDALVYDPAVVRVSLHVHTSPDDIARIIETNPTAPGCGLEPWRAASWPRALLCRADAQSARRRSAVLLDDPDVFWPLWTRAEVRAKPHEIPIAAWLRLVDWTADADLGVPLEVVTVVSAARVVCYGVREPHGAPVT